VQTENVNNKITQIIEAHNELVSKLQTSGLAAVVAAAEVITNALDKAGRVYICGNGGSAADAQHIAAEFVGKFERRRRALPAVALTTDTSVITSIANDDGYQNIFERQTEALVADGDIFWALSTSGTSENVLAAAKLAKHKGASILAFTGKKDTELEKLADICLCANSTSTARSQEIHQLAYHIICKLVEENFAES